LAKQKEATIVPYSDVELQEYEIESPSNPTLHQLKFLEEKSSESSFTNCWYGFRHHRLPWVGFSTQSAMIALLYICMLVGSVFVNTVYAYNVGDLIAVNAFLSMIPATRNGLLVVLLGVPLDRAIMYHRWLGRTTLFLATTRIHIDKIVLEILSQHCSQ
jgi:hypothetical protein